MMKQVDSGPLAGYAAVSIDRSSMAEYENAVFHADKFYGLGYKDQHLGYLPTIWLKDTMGRMCIDCSGFIRSILWYSCVSLRNLYPDGSVVQRQWLIDQGFKIEEASSYNEVAGNQDNILRIWFHKPGGTGLSNTDADPFGHTWCTLNGYAKQSCGGVGPCEVPWNDRTLEGIIDFGVCIGIVE